METKYSVGIVLKYINTKRGKAIIVFDFTDCKQIITNESKYFSPNEGDIVNIQYKDGYKNLYPLHKESEVEDLPQ